MSIFNFQQRLWNWCENDLKSLLAFILSLVFCGCSPPHTATPPLFPAFSPSQRNVWYSRDCLLFFSLQSTLLLFSPPYSFQLSSFASWCLFFLPFSLSVYKSFLIVFFNTVIVSRNKNSFIYGCYAWVKVTRAITLHIKHSAPCPLKITKSN